MLCKNCGSQLEEGTKFCGTCGTSISSPSVGVDEKPKKNFVGPVIGIIAVLLIVGGVYLRFFSNNNHKIVKDLINNAYDKLEGLTITKDTDVIDESILVSGDLTVSTNISGLESLSQDKLSYTLGVDYPNNKMEMSAALRENGKSIIDVAMYILDNAGYVSFKDDFDKLIKFDIDDVNEIFSSTNSGKLTDDDIKYLTKAYKNILIKTLKGSDFEKSSSTILLDGKETKVTKLTYNMTGSKFQNLTNDIIYETLQDSKLLEILAKATDSSIDDVKELLEMSKMDGNYDSDEHVAFDIYTKGRNNEFVGMDIQGIITIRKNSDNLTISAGMGSEKITIVFKNIDDNTSVIEFNASIDGSEISGSLKITFKDVSDKKSEGSIVFDLTYDEVQLTITNNFTIVTGAVIADVDTSNSINYENLTVQDENKIMNSIENKFINSNLYKLFEDLMPSSSSYSNSYSSSSSSSIGSSAEMNKIIGYGKSVELAYTQYQYAKALNSDLSDIVVPAGTDNSILLTIDGKSVNIAVDYDYDVTCIGNNTISMGKVSLKSCRVNGGSAFYNYSNGSASLAN